MNTAAWGTLWQAAVFFLFCVSPLVPILLPFSYISSSTVPTFPPPLSSIHPKPGIHTLGFPLMTAFVPGAVSDKCCVDTTAGSRDDDDGVGGGSALCTALGSIMGLPAGAASFFFFCCYFFGLFRFRFYNNSSSEAGVSAGKIACVDSSGFASISAFMASFTGSAGTFFVLGATKPNSGVQSDTSGDYDIIDKYLFHCASSF